MIKNSMFCAMYRNVWNDIDLVVELKAAQRDRVIELFAEEY